jgi:glycosyltransferase involved in cell wall biosynthesis
MYLQDKKNAVIIEPNSAQAVADAIQYLIADSNNAETIGAAGKEVAKQNFDVNVAGKNFKNLLMDL